MADNCSINYSVVPAVDSVIRELEHNNPASCVKLSELINTDDFINYVKSDEQGKDVTDLASIGNLRKSTLRRLIREYRNSKIFKRSKCFIYLSSIDTCFALWWSSWNGERKEKSSRRISYLYVSLCWFNVSYAYESIYLCGIW